jgi:hypothetical protein
MKFGEVLEGLLQGRMYQRQHWMDDGIFIFRVPGSTFEANREPMQSVFGKGKEVTYHEHIDMHTAQGFVVPWNISQVDVFAQDWIEYGCEQANVGMYEIHFVFDSEKEAKNLFDFLNIEVDTVDRNTLKTTDCKIFETLFKRSVQTLTINIQGSPFIPGHRKVNEQEILDKSIISAAVFNIVPSTREPKFFISGNEVIGKAYVTIGFMYKKDPVRRARTVKKLSTVVSKKFLLMFKYVDQTMQAFQTFQSIIFDENYSSNHNRYRTRIWDTFREAEEIRIDLGNSLEEFPLEEMDKLLLAPGTYLATLGDYQVGSFVLEVTLSVQEYT